VTNFDILIKNGTVVDGARNPRYKGDVGIKDGRITAVGKIRNAEADRVIDAEGLIVAPGFIDLHTHYDGQVFWDPYLTTSGWNGVTSVVIGNCGFGFAPLAPELRDRAMQSMTKVESIPLATLQSALPWDWESFPEYLDSVDRQPKALNVLAYVPVNPLLISVLGIDDAKAGRKPTEEENAEICRLLVEAMDAGACGWSAQCLGVEGDPEATTSGGAAQSDFDGTPMPTDVMWQETRMALSKVLGERGEGFIQLSGAMIPPNEWEDMAEVSQAPMIYQAIVPSGDMREMNASLFQWFESCRDRGLQIYGQGITQNPPIMFTFDYWDLWGETWIKYAGPDVSTADTLANLAREEVRADLKEQPTKYMFIDDIKDAVITKSYADEYQSFIGKTVGDIADAQGKHVVDAICDLVVADELKTEFHIRQFDTTLEGIKQLIDDPYVVPGLSDGGAHLKYLPAGSYATEYIADYVREHKFSSLEDAHWRLSALPAFCAGFKDRGTLVEGAAADIVIYDYENIKVLEPEFLHDLPGDEYRAASRGEGYKYVLVNGEVTIEDDKQTETYSGKLLRGGHAA